MVLPIRISPAFLFNQKTMTVFLNRLAFDSYAGLRGVIFMSFFPRPQTLLIKECCIRCSTNPYCFWRCGVPFLTFSYPSLRAAFSGQRSNSDCGQEWAEDGKNGTVKEVTVSKLTDLEPVQMAWFSCQESLLKIGAWKDKVADTDLLGEPRLVVVSDLGMVEISQRMSLGLMEIVYNRVRTDRGTYRYFAQIPLTWVDKVWRDGKNLVVAITPKNISKKKPKTKIRKFRLWTA